MRKSCSLFVMYLLVLSCNHQGDTSGKDTAASKTSSTIGSSAKNADTKLNIDALQASPENFRLLFENEHVRVLEYSLKPGAKDKPHTHPPKSGYVLSGGKLKIYPGSAAAFISEDSTGMSYWSDYVGKHYVENIGNTTVTIILTEIKSLN